MCGFPCLDGIKLKGSYVPVYPNKCVSVSRIRIIDRLQLVADPEIFKLILIFFKHSDVLSKYQKCYTIFLMETFVSEGALSSLCLSKLFIPLKAKDKTDRYVAIKFSVFMSNFHR